MAVMIHQTDEQRRIAILREARRSFMELGYAQTRMEPVARLAGVSTATLYALFIGKSELFEAVIKESADEFARQMDTVNLRHGPTRQQLTAFARAYATFMADPFVRSVFRLVIAERPRFRGVAMGFFERGRTDFGAVLMQALSEMAVRGELALDKPSWAAGQLMGMIEHPIFFMPLVTGEENMAQRSAHDVADDAVETFLARYGATRA
ncbi:MAG: TetR/AcrR family transcriptional regulator [Brevundimonas sp.]|nr:MAG: TetR/AcrR family transcriptional regulator [Brevundimonas sp.]